MLPSTLYGLVYALEGSRRPHRSVRRDFGDGASRSDPSPSHTYATPGKFVVTLSVTDDNRGLRPEDGQGRGEVI